MQYLPRKSIFNKGSNHSVKDALRNNVEIQFCNNNTSLSLSDSGY